MFSSAQEGILFSTVLKVECASDHYYMCKNGSDLQVVKMLGPFCSLTGPGSPFSVFHRFSLAEV